MKARGHEVVVLGRDGTELQRYCKQDGIPFIVIENHKKYYDFKAAGKLSALLKEWQMQHLIIRDVRDMSVAAAAKYWRKHPFQLHYFMEMQLGVKKKGPLQTMRFRELTSWSCPLLWLEHQVETRTNVPKEKIIHIPSGLELAPLQKPLSQQEARKLLDVPGEGMLIGLAGRFDPQKGQLLLLEALPQVGNKQVGIVLLGSATHNEGQEYYDSMLRFIDRHQLQDRVFIRPFRRDVQVFYKAIDAFVMASKAETFGMVTIESMACGTPVIGSNAGGTPELLDYGKLGYLFEPLSSGDLALKIAQFLQDPKRFKPEELKKAMQFFDHERVCALVELRLKLTSKKLKDARIES
jgi:glycosyltransferase involved in cell wall biosynthesis